MLASTRCIVKLEQLFIVNQNIATTRFVLQLFHFEQQFTVLFEEGVFGFPIAFHQRTANEDFTTH